MPDPVDPAAALAAFRQDLDLCRSILKGGSKSFFAASLLLPSAIREPAMALYAFCRIADDAVDEAAAVRGTGAGHEAVEQLRERLDRLYAGRPLPHPADRAFAEVVLTHRLPRIVIDALIEGFAWDAAGRRYRSVEDLHAYGARVAGAVGVLMTLVMGRREPDVLARAADLGVAMQLTNIARDVGEDARNGRLYLPEGWLIEAGIDPDAFLAEPQFTPALRGVIARLLAEAERLYLRADAGIARLPVGCRPSIRAARLIYAEIGRELARIGHDSVARRAVVPTARKLTLLARAFIPLMPSGALARAPVLAANAFLVEAVQALPAPPDQPRLHAAWQAPARPAGSGGLAGVLRIIEKLERQDRLTGTGGDLRGRSLA